MAARKPLKLTKQQRVSEIRLMMAQGHWVTGVTGPKLAAQWGVTYDVLRRDAAEASRRQREDLFSREEMRGMVVGQLQTYQGIAERKGRIRDAIEAVRKVANVMGLHTQTIEHEMRGQIKALLETIRGACSGQERLSGDEWYARVVAALGGGGAGDLVDGEPAEEASAAGKP